MGYLVKLRQSITYISGDPGQPGYPGSPAIPASCEEYTDTIEQVYLRVLVPGLEPPECVVGQLIPGGGTCPRVPLYELSAYDPPRFTTNTYTICTPYQPAVPAVAYIPPTPAETIIDYNYGWNAGANSITYLDNGDFTFTVTRGAAGAIVGLSVGTWAPGYADILYGFHAVTGLARIIEAGVGKTGFIPFDDGDEFKIERQGLTVKYYINDVLQYTSLTPAVDQNFYLKSVLWAGDDAIPTATMEQYASGTGSVDLEPLISAGDGHTPGDNWSTTDLYALTGDATGKTLSSGSAELPTLRSIGYADYDAWADGELPGLESSGQGRAIGEIGPDGLPVNGGTSYTSLPALEGSGHEPGYEWGDAEFEPLASYGEGGLIINDLIASTVILHAPAAGICTGLTGEIGNGGAVLPVLDALASEGIYGESYTSLLPLTANGLSFGNGAIMSAYIGSKFSLVATGKRKVTGLSSLQQDIPGITIEAFTGAQVVGNVPAFSLDIQGSIPVIGRLDEDIPGISIVSNGRSGSISAVIGNVPAISFTGHFGGYLKKNIPSITANSSATGGGTASVTKNIPKITFKILGRVSEGNGVIGTIPPITMGGVARLTAITPALVLRSTAARVVAVAAVAEGYNVNIKNGAVTEHDYMPINKIVEWGNEYYGVGPDGIYLMEGLQMTDLSYPQAEMSLSGIGDEDTALKRLSEVLVRHRSSVDIEVTVTPDEKAPRTYIIRQVDGDQLATRREKTRRGIKARSWQFKLTGSALDIDMIDIPLVNLKSRRIG